MVENPVPCRIRGRLCRIPCLYRIGLYRCSILDPSRVDLRTGLCCIRDDRCTMSRSPCRNRFATIEVSPKI